MAGTHQTLVAGVFINPLSRGRVHTTLSALTGGRTLAGLWSGRRFSNLLALQLFKLFNCLIFAASDRTAKRWFPKSPGKPLARQVNLHSQNPPLPHTSKKNVFALKVCSPKSASPNPPTVVPRRVLTTAHRPPPTTPPNRKRKRGAYNPSHPTSLLDHNQPIPNSTRSVSEGFATNPHPPRHLYSHPLPRPPAETPGASPEPTRPPHLPTLPNPSPAAAARGFAPTAPPRHSIHLSPRPVTISPSGNPSPPMKQFLDQELE